jgi:hypothetical protein
MTPYREFNDMAPAPQTIGRSDRRVESTQLRVRHSQKVHAAQKTIIPGPQSAR